MQIQKKLEAARKAIMDACTDCNGRGCRQCASKVECINIYSQAGIPVAYWAYTLKTFAGNASVQKWIQDSTQNINQLYVDGRSILLHGLHGVGKTFGACEILKAAALAGYTIKYTTMSEIIDMVLAKGERLDFKASLLLSDFLVIDEFDGRYIPNTERGQDMFGATLENIIRTRFQNKLPIIFCTNEDDKGDGRSPLISVFDGTFKLTYSSLFANSNLINIFVPGADLR